MINCHFYLHVKAITQSVLGYKNSHLSNTVLESDICVTSLCRHRDKKYHNSTQFRSLNIHQADKTQENNLQISVCLYL